jgi:hypothetical protein
MIGRGRAAPGRPRALFQAGKPAVAPDARRLEIGSNRST